MAANSKKILVTGGNAGIGFALCKQLAVEKGCHVFLGSRSIEKGEKAVKEISSLLSSANSGGKIELIQIDVGKDDSVAAAASKLQGQELYAIVNNAGAGLAHGVSYIDVLNTNYEGPKRVCKAFIPLLSKAGPTDSRIVNVGSGGGPMFVSKVPRNDPIHAALISDQTTIEQMDQIRDNYLGSRDPEDKWFWYTFSKAALMVFTMQLAKQLNGKHLVACCTPGYIDTAMTAGMGASKKPEEGTVSLHKCLFGDLGGSGWFWGSDGLRSPLHYMRDPGTAEYDGVVRYD